jgi:hypothetical protein
MSGVYKVVDTNYHFFPKDQLVDKIDGTDKKDDGVEMALYQREDGFQQWLQPYQVEKIA